MTEKTTTIPQTIDRDPRDSWLSVTHILRSAGLSPWPEVTLDMLRRGITSGIDERKLRYIMQGVYPDVLDAAAERGSLIHLAIEDIEKMFVEAWWEDCEIQPYVSAYLKFREDARYRATSVELKVYNESYRYRGILDSLGMLDGKYEVLLDVKTVKRMDPSIGLQLAGYEGALPVNPKRVRLGLQLLQDGTYRLHEYRDKNDHKIFLAALSIVHWKEHQQ